MSFGKQFFTLFLTAFFLSGCSILNEEMETESDMTLYENSEQQKADNFKFKDGIEKLISEYNIFDNEEINQVDLIQSFLDKYPGPLKSFSKIQTYKIDKNVTEEQEISAAFMLWDSCEDINLSFNCQILLTFLELTTNALTDPLISMEEIEKELRLLNNARERESLYETLLSMGHFINEELGVREVIQITDLELKNGDKIKLDQSIGNDEYILKKILAKFANSKEQWSLWTSEKTESFYSLYRNLFFSQNKVILYKNREYNFSLEYPNHWKNREFISLEENVILHIADANFTAGPGDAIPLSLKVKAFNKAKYRKPVFIDYADLKSVLKPVNTDKSLINNILFRREKYINGAPEWSENIIHLFEFEKNEYIYVFEFQYYLVGCKGIFSLIAEQEACLERMKKFEQDNIDLIEDIIASVKFPDTPIINQELLNYSNKELGFSFSYPKHLGQVFTEFTPGSPGSQFIGKFEFAEKLPYINKISFGSISKDYGIGDIGKIYIGWNKGFSTEGTSYTFHYGGQYGDDYQIQPREIIQNKTGQKVIILDDQSFVELKNVTEGPTSQIKPEENNIVAVINLKSDTYKALTFNYFKNKKLTEKEFIEILQSLKVFDP